MEDGQIEWVSCYCHPRLDPGFIFYGLRHTMRDHGLRVKPAMTNWYLRRVSNQANLMPPGTLVCCKLNPGPVLDFTKGYQSGE